jgi:hypothetical protein
MNQDERSFTTTLIYGLWLDIKILCPGINWRSGLVSTHLLLREHGYYALTEQLPTLDNFVLARISGGPSLSLEGNLLQLWLLFEPFVRGDNTTSSKHALEAIRQLAVFGKKLQVEPRPGSDEKMLNRFVATDQSLPITLKNFAELKLAKRLLSEVLPPIGEWTMYGRHGAGSVAERELTPGKRWDMPMQTTPELFRLNPLCADYILPYYFGTAANLRVNFVKRFVPSEVTTVPKDGRGPRIICKESASLMFHELALMDLLYNHMNTHPLLKGRTNVLDQKINKELARIGSITGQYATLDLSEASDRVSVALCKLIFPVEWFTLLMAHRSPYCRVQGRLHIFKKFAPMGSALCFPVETLVFWALASATVARQTGMSLIQASQSVTVHGDDTIVPTHCALKVAETFELCALKVNHEKSFLTGPFRESCGGDYFHGHDVTPVRWNHVCNRGDQGSIGSTFELANNFYKKGWWATARAIREWLSESISGWEPFWFTGSEYQPNGWGHFSYIAGGAVVSTSHKARNSKDNQLCSPLVRTYSVVATKAKHQPKVAGRYTQYIATRRKYTLDEYIERSVIYSREPKLRRAMVAVQASRAGALAAYHLKR